MNRRGRRGQGGGGQGILRITILTTAAAFTALMPYVVAAVIRTDCKRQEERGFCLFVILLLVVVKNK
jgi:hypothetical protein